MKIRSKILDKLEIAKYNKVTLKHYILNHKRNRFNESEERNFKVGKKKRKRQKKKKELLEKQLRKTEIETYEALTSIIISIVTMLIAFITAVLSWFK